MPKYLAGDKYRTKSRIPFRGADPLIQKKQNTIIVMVIVAAIFAILVSQQRAKRSKGAPPIEQDQHNVTLASGPSAKRALEYVKAIQERRFERVFQMTQWMQERVGLIRLESDPEVVDQDVESFYQQEKRNFFAQGIGGPITDEGISDPHLFPPGAVVRLIGVEEVTSRPLLDKGQPVDRVLVEVEYPESVTAPVAADGKRIDKLRAALYMNRDGRIVKASVRGNASVEATAHTRRGKTTSVVPHARNVSLMSWSCSGQGYRLARFLTECDREEV